MIQAGTSPWTIALDGMPIAILKGDTATATGYAEILSREPSHTGPVWEGQARQRLAVFYLTTGDTASAGAEVREAIALGERHNHPATIVEGHLLAARMSFRIDAPETLGDPAEHTLQAIRTQPHLSRRNGCAPDSRSILSRQHSSADSSGMSVPRY